MAIQINVTTPDGVIHPQAYARLVYTQLDHENNQAVLVVKLYDSAATRTANKDPVQARTYNLGPALFGSYFSDALLAKATPAAQAYTYLATVPDYAGGVSV